MSARPAVTRACAPLLVALAAALAALAAPPSALAVRAGGQAPPKPPLDVRAGTTAPVPAPVESARAGLRRRLGAQGTVSVDRHTGGLRLVAATDQLLTDRSPDDPAAVALDYVRAHLDAFGLQPADLDALRLIGRSTSPDGVTHLAWAQVADGVPAYDSELTANVARDGRLLNVGGAPVHGLDIPSADPPLGPAAARSAAQRAVGVTPDGDPGRIGSGPERPTTFAGGDRAHLTVVAQPSGDDRLAWRMTVAGTAPYVYDVVVDAASGAVLARHSLTDFAMAANAWPYHPSGAGQAPSVDLTPYFTAGSSPADLDGLYAHAYADVDDDDVPDASEEVSPDGNGDFSFSTTSVAPVAGQPCATAFSAPCTWDGADGTTAAVNQDAAVTQLFWFVDNYHDWLAQPPIGFDAGSSNFEGPDKVIAQADDGAALNDGGHIDNANMATYPEGQSPVMQMYLFSAPYAAVDGDFDASVVYHEYTHGLSNRLVGGDGQADGLYARQSEAMGEGWSDWYAMDYLVAHGLQADDPSAPGDVVVGAYVTNDTRVGIRYNALDCPVGAPGSACPGSATAGPGGFTFADLGRVTATVDTSHPYFEVHADGEIWSETLWDLREALGATTARGLITDAMRLSPKNPSFLDMRDAILQADLAAGGAHHDAIWKVFAARGMGYGATTNGANATRGVASFDVPPLAHAGVPAVTSGGSLGDGDGALEPGEAARIRLALTNPGTQALTGVRATLQAATPGVFVGQPSAGYGTIAGGDTASADQAFTVSVAPSVACGTLLSLTLSVTSDQGSFSVPVSIPLGSGSVSATRTDGRTIPDGQPGGGITSYLSIPNPGRVDHLRVSVAIDHSYMGDLHAWLTSPAGTTIDLMENAGADGGTDANLSASAPIVFDDAAAVEIQDVPSGDTTTMTGTFRPDEPLSRFAGQDRAGVWALRIVDVWSQDQGTLHSWTLQTDQPACSATGPALPAPATDAPTGAIGDAATLHGHLDPGGTATQVQFEYGPTTAYGTRTDVQSLSASGGSQAFDAAVSGLAAGTTYHVRALALRDGTVVAAGADRTFTAGTVAPPAAPAAAAAPTTTTQLQVPAHTASTHTPAVRHFHPRVRADRHGRVLLRFVATPGGRRAVLTIQTRHGHHRRLGRRHFRIRHGGHVRVHVRLNRSARRALRHHRTLHVRVRLHFAGTTFHRRLTIRPRR